MRKITFEIPQEFDKSTVENYLIKEKHFSNRLLRKLKRVENGILCNKKHARSIDTIYKGDLLEVFL
ncbi:MAG: RluA family pseudouridine synthase, partial [Oscillospiraceae bacterium]